MIDGPQLRPKIKSLELAIYDPNRTVVAPVPLSPPLVRPGASNTQGEATEIRPGLCGAAKNKNPKVYFLLGPFLHLPSVPAAAADEGPVAMGGDVESSSCPRYTPSPSRSMPHLNTFSMLVEIPRDSGRGRGASSSSSSPPGGAGGGGARGRGAHRSPRGAEPGHRFHHGPLLRRGRDGLCSRRGRRRHGTARDVKQERGHTKQEREDDGRERKNR